MFIISYFVKTLLQYYTYIQAFSSVEDQVFVNFYWWQTIPGNTNSFPLDESVAPIFISLFLCVCVCVFVLFWYWVGVNGIHVSL